MQVKCLEKQNKALNEKEQNLDDRFRILEANSNLLDDTLHEIRKINQQMQSNISILYDTVNNLYVDDENRKKLILNTLKTLDANSTLLSIRMNAYDILFNPDSARKELDSMLTVYSKVEKVYKCLYPSRKDKNLEIILHGGSKKQFRLRYSIELAFFIVIENAIKYSPEGEQISIFFEDTLNGLNVKFCNWAICPNDEEFNRLTERGFRSKKVANKTEYKGRGLGLFLLKEICETNQVNYQFSKEQNTKTISGQNYNQFVVTLSFYD